MIDLYLLLPPVPVTPLKREGVTGQVTGCEWLQVFHRLGTSYRFFIPVLGIVSLLRGPWFHFVLPILEEKGQRFRKRTSPYLRNLIWLPEFAAAFLALHLPRNPKPDYGFYLNRIDTFHPLMASCFYGLLDFIMARRPISKRLPVLVITDIDGGD